MLRKIFLPSIFATLAWGFWVSTDFKVIAAGVAIFLFGMLSMEEGFKAFTGGTLESILHRSTNRLWKSIGFGVVTTTLMQSSSLVSVITISFLSAGLIELAQGIGIIFGANLGTTTGAWLIAGFGLKVHISAYAMPMLVFGVILLFQPGKAARGIGYILAGLGFLFLGIHFMKDGFESFKEAIDLAEYAIPGFLGLLAYAAMGILATVVMQSSHATLVLTLTALAAGQISYENGLGLAIGANVGTTITAVLGSISANIEGRRLAAAHVVFNLATGIIAIASIRGFMTAVDFLAAKLGIMADDFTLKLAIFHTLFNLVGVLVTLPFIGRLVALLERLMKPPASRALRPRYLNDAALDLPDAALVALRKEVANLFEQALEIMARGLDMSHDVIRHGEQLQAQLDTRLRHADYDIEMDYEARLKNIYGEIIAFASKLRTSVPTERADELYELRNAARGIVEAVKEIKHLHANLARYTRHENADIRAEYNRLRLMLAEVLAAVYGLCIEQREDATLLALDALKVSKTEAASELDLRLEQLIRGQRISAAMATSLMNDSNYAFTATKALLAVGRALYAPQPEGEREAEREVSLDDEELAVVQEHKRESDG